MKIKIADGQRGYYQYLKNKYKDILIPQYKTSDQMISFLSDRFTVKELEKEEIPALYLQIQVENFVNSKKGEEYHLGPDTLQLRIFEILRDEKSEGYFKTVIPMCRGDESPAQDERLVVLLEEKSNLIACNSSFLTLELFVEIGIRLDDYKNEKEEYYWYLHILDEYEKAKEG